MVTQKCAMCERLKLQLAQVTAERDKLAAKLGAETLFEPVVSAAPSVAAEEAIYEAYPRKVGKAAALKAIGKVLMTIAERHGSRRAAAAWLIARVKAFATSPAGNAGQFTPHPATWFNAGRYDDDPAQWQVKRDETDPRRKASDDAQAAMKAMRF